MTTSNLCLDQNEPGHPPARWPRAAASRWPCAPSPPPPSPPAPPPPPPPPRSRASPRPPRCRAPPPPPAAPPPAATASPPPARPAACHSSASRRLCGSRGPHSPPAHSPAHKKTRFIGRHSNQTRHK